MIDAREAFEAYWASLATDGTESEELLRHCEFAARNAYAAGRASTPPPNYSHDEKALEVARAIDESTYSITFASRRTALIQLAVLDAMRWAACGHIADASKMVAASAPPQAPKCSEASLREIDLALAAMADLKPLTEYGEPGTYDTVQARRKTALKRAEGALLYLHRELAAGAPQDVMRMALDAPIESNDVIATIDDHSHNPPTVRHARAVELDNAAAIAALLAAIATPQQGQK